VVRGPLGIGEDRVAILFSGKLSRRKGPDLLVDAVKRLPAEQRNRVVLLFLGGGEEEARLKRQCAASPALPAHFLGFRNQRALTSYYHAADLLALPSRHSETWGLVVNEALHHGVPCVVSDMVGCGPDLIEAGATGEVARSGSVESLSDAIARGLTLTGALETRKRCREKVSGYTVEKAAEGIARAYCSLASPGASKRNV
jgi:glycosyltransferase involved in cell wall biosynthesis